MFYPGMHSPRFVLLLDVRAEGSCATDCQLAVHETPYFLGRIASLFSCECVSDRHPRHTLAGTHKGNKISSHFPF